MKHDVVSIRLAERRGEMPKRVEMSFAMLPTVMMAMVLLAVQMLVRAVSNEIMPSPPLLLPILRVITRMSQSKPPAVFTIFIMPPASSVTRISSHIDCSPEPADSNIVSIGMP